MYISESKSDAEIVRQLRRIAQRGANVVATAVTRTPYPGGIGDGAISLTGHTAYRESTPSEAIERLAYWEGIPFDAYLYHISIRRGTHCWSGRTVIARHPYVIWANEHPEMFLQSRLRHGYG